MTKIADKPLLALDWAVVDAIDGEISKLIEEEYKRLGSAVYFEIQGMRQAAGRIRDAVAEARRKADELHTCAEGESHE